MKQGEIRIFSLSILFLFGTQGLAAPSTNVAWSSEIRALVASGDFESGEKLAGQCAPCHGASGEGKIIHYSALAGQMSRYMSQTMQNYKKGQRANDIYRRMRLIAAKLSELEIKALADYYASLESR